MKSNNGKLPSVNHIKEGLKKLGREEMKKAMGNVADQKMIQKAIDELDKTWDQMFDLAQIYDLDAPLQYGWLEDENGDEVEDEDGNW